MSWLRMAAVLFASSLSLGALCAFVGGLAGLLAVPFGVLSPVQVFGTLVGSALAYLVGGRMLKLAHLR